MEGCAARPRCSAWRGWVLFHLPGAQLLSLLGPSGLLYGSRVEVSNCILFDLPWTKIVTPRYIYSVHKRGGGDLPVCSGRGQPLGAGGCVPGRLLTRQCAPQCSAEQPRGAGPGEGRKDCCVFSSSVALLPPGPCSGAPGLAPSTHGAVDLQKTSM